MENLMRIKKRAKILKKKNRNKLDLKYLVLIIFKFKFYNNKLYIKKLT